MTESTQSEIDIEQLKNSIRSAVAQRQAEGRATFIKASAELFELLSAKLRQSQNGSMSLGDFSASQLTPLSLQPEFSPNPDDHYHVDDLLKYHNAQFVWNAYRAILKREPDEWGLKTYMEQLSSGRFNKIDVLASLKHSREGRRNNVTIDGLGGRAFIRRAYGLPVLGYLMELATGLARLPSLIRHQRATETYLIAQQETTAAHFNRAESELREAIEQLSDSLTRSFSELTNEQQRFARLQHRQMAGLFAAQQTQGASTNGDGLVHAANRAFASANNYPDQLGADFQDQFRGDFEAVKESLKVYLPLLSDSNINDAIVDLGCGRGEWLELLRQKGIKARGVDANAVLAARAQSHGIEVIESDAIAYLRGLSDHELNAVTAFHFVEHLRLDQLIKLLSEIRRTLKPGGLLIIETPNPKNLVVGACNFHSDPTHRQPLFPETLEFLIQHAGFAHTRLLYLHPVEGSPFTGRDEASRALDSWFFSPRDYAVIADNPQ